MKKPKINKLQFRAIEEIPAEGMDGFKFEHILLSVTIAHNREIGQFDDTCAGHVEKAMGSYQGVLMVDAKAQYRHCSEDQHFANCTCGLCDQVRNPPQLSEQPQPPTPTPQNPMTATQEAPVRGTLIPESLGQKRPGTRSPIFTFNVGNPETSQDSRVTVGEFLDVDSQDESDEIMDRLQDEASAYLDSKIDICNRIKRLIVDPEDLVDLQQSSGRPSFLIDIPVGDGLTAALPVTIQRTSSRNVESFDWLNLFPRAKESAFDVLLKGHVLFIAKSINTAAERAIAEDLGLPEFRDLSDDEIYDEEARLSSFIEKNVVLFCSAADLDIHLDWNRHNVEASASIAAGLGWMKRG